MKTPYWLLGVALVAAPGCTQAPKIAPVSGVVTLNGKPLANATVAFSPIAKEGAIDAGDGSAGKTNAQGEFTLTTSRGAPGAWVGKHRVRISVMVNPPADVDERRASRAPAQKDMIPVRYNGETTLTFDVVAGTNNKANFDLISP